MAFRNITIEFPHLTHIVAYFQTLQFSEAFSNMI